MPPEDYMDGCTQFPDEIAGNDLSMCCDAHDIAYWNAETLDAKFEADVELFQCIASTGNDLLMIVVAIIMFVGVITGGTYYWYKKDEKWKAQTDETESSSDGRP